MDIDKEYVIIFGGMCTKRQDGEYFFYAPYYGDSKSNHRRGLCYVADCELLDPLLLTKSDRRIKYEEHYGKFEQAVNDFNTKYLGGVAHELGHALSLPHNGELKEERAGLGAALMGGGNHTYRREKWSDKKGAFMTMATAVRLASTPLFCGSQRGQNVSVECVLKDLKFTGDKKEMLIEGRLECSPGVYAVIAYLDPDGKGSYDALAWVAPIKQNKFQIKAYCEKNKSHKLRLEACHLNGAVSKIFKDNFVTNEQLEPDVALMSSRWLTEPKK